MTRNLLKPAFPLSRDDVGPEAEECATTGDYFLTLAGLAFLLGALIGLAGFGLLKVVF